MTSPPSRPSPKATRWFGTDGIRAPFGETPLDEKTVRAVGFHAARSVAQPARVFLAGDTRDSTPVLAKWMMDGIHRAGGTAVFAGTLPTPGVAHVVRTGGFNLGVAISASHNPWPDNGIKLFDAAGFKWSVAEEEALEERLHDDRAGAPDGSTQLESTTDPALAEPYLESLRSALPTGALGGIHVVLDCAHGATTPFAGELFAGLGAEVTVTGAAPDGRNINAGVGSTHLEPLAAETARVGADLGVAFDGDGDRALFADESGRTWDGDALLYLWATGLHAAGELTGARIVATSMSNIGLERALAERGIGVERCGVGDRVVVDTMRRLGLRLGGEQSGHIVDLERSSTGDGLLTALYLAHRVAAGGRPVSELLTGFRRFPQILHNVRVKSKPPLEELPSVVAHAEKIERRLAENGRLVLRYSGTEPLARVMIEGADQSEIESMALDLCATIQAAIGSAPS